VGVKNIQNIPKLAPFPVPFVPCSILRSSPATEDGRQGRRDDLLDRLLNGFCFGGYSILLLEAQQIVVPRVAVYRVLIDDRNIIKPCSYLVDRNLEPDFIFAPCVLKGLGVLKTKISHFAQNDILIKVLLRRETNARVEREIVLDFGDHLTKYSAQLLLPG
jgi:hypothetical protein